MLGIGVGGNFDASASARPVQTRARVGLPLCVCLCAVLIQADKHTSLLLHTYIETKKFVLSNNTNLYSNSQFKRKHEYYFLLVIFGIYPTVFAARTTVASRCTLNNNLNMIHLLIDRKWLFFVVVF